MNRRALSVIGTGVGSLVAFFVIGVLIGSHFATNRVHAVLPALTNRTIPLAQTIGSGPTDPTVGRVAQPIINDAAIPTAAPHSISNAEEQARRSTGASITLFAPPPVASSSASPTSSDTSRVDGHELFIAGGPRVPLQDIAHFVDPCATALAASLGCPQGVAGTVLLTGDDPLLQPLVIQHINSLEGTPTAEYQQCVVNDTTPIPSGDARFAITSNNPASFTAVDPGTGETLATASTDAALRTAFGREEVSELPLTPVTTCIDLPIGTTRNLIVTGTDDNSTTASAALEVGPEQQGGRPPVSVQGDDSDPLGAMVGIPLRSEDHESAIVSVIQYTSFTSAPACASEPPTSPSTDAVVTASGTVPTAYPVDGYPYDRSYDAWEEFHVRALNEWHEAAYLLCIYWMAQPHSFSPVQLEDAEAIPVIFPETLAYTITLQSIDVETGGGPATSLPSPVALTLHQNDDPSCPLTISGPLDHLALPAALCNVSTADGTDGGLFLVDALWGDHDTSDWVSLPPIMCTANPVSNTGTDVAGILTGGLSLIIQSNTSQLTRAGQTCVHPDQWFDVQASDGTGDTAMLRFMASEALVLPDSATLFSGTPSPVAGAGAGTTGTLPPPPAINPQLDLFSTSLNIDDADPAHSLILQWVADRPVAVRPFFDSYDTTTCSEPPSAISVASAPAMSGSIVLSHLCAGTHYAVGVAITDSDGHTSTYSTNIRAAPPGAIDIPVDFQGTTGDNRVSFNAKLHLMEPTGDSPDYALITALDVTVNGETVMNWVSGSDGSGASRTFTSALCISANDEPNGTSIGLDPANGVWPQNPTVRITADYVYIAGTCSNRTGTVPAGDALLHEDDSFTLTEPLANDTGLTLPIPGESEAAAAGLDVLGVEIDKVQPDD